MTIYNVLTVAAVIFNSEIWCHQVLFEEGSLTEDKLYIIKNILSKFGQDTCCFKSFTEIEKKKQKNFWVCV